MTRLAVVGAGYVGLTTAAVFASLGYDVTCADVDATKVERLSRGDVPIFEPGLEDLVRDGLDAGRLRFTVDGPAAAAQADIVFLCVPTAAEVQAVVADIRPSLRPSATLVVKSTVPVGTTRAVGAVANPEFLREGSAVHDALHPHRVVIGADDPAEAEPLVRLYEPFGVPVVVTDPASAELAKHAANAFLAVKVSFVNDFAALCEATGADIDDVVRVMGLDPRIGTPAMAPGPGWGGSCLPKDARALLATAAEAGVEAAVVHGAVEANERQVRRVVEKVVRMVGGDVAGKTVAVWGLAFKAGTDDVRESPALAVVDHLRRLNALIKTYDPAARSDCTDPYTAAEGADVVVVLTEWDELREVDLDKVAGLAAAPRIVDARNVFDPEAVRRHGFAYDSLGRA